MKEYERNFKAETIEPYLEYCRANGYEEEVVEQNRIVFENKFNSHLIARLTTDIVDGKRTTVFDCKNVGKRVKDLKISEESEPLVVTEKTRDVILSILNVMEFYETANNLRKRYIFKKNNVTFEIDDYERPKMKVVAVEGDEKEVDRVYAEVLNIKV